MIRIDNVRILDEPFQVEHLLNNDVYWCFGYTREYLYVKKVKSTNKHYKVFKLYSVYAVLDKHLESKIKKSINWHKKNDKSIKLSQYYNHYNIKKNIDRKYRYYLDWISDYIKNINSLRDKITTTKFKTCTPDEFEDVGF